MSDRPSVDARHPLPHGADWRRWEMTSFDEPEVAIEPEVPAEPEPAGPSLEEIIQAARDEAYREAYQLGQADGHKQGYMQGLTEGRQTGHAEGLAAGHAEGLVEGREQGRQEAAHLNALVSRVAEAMGSRVGQCSVRQLDVVVDVEVPVRFGRWHLGVAHGQARAGPGER